MPGADYYQFFSKERSSGRGRSFLLFYIRRWVRLSIEVLLSAILCLITLILIQFYIGIMNARNYEHKMGQIELEKKIKK